MLQTMALTRALGLSDKEGVEKNCELSVSVALVATNMKAHQDATRDPLPVKHQKLGKGKAGRNSKLMVAENCVGLALSIRLVPGN